VQNNEEEDTLVGVFGAAAAAKEAQVSSLHKKCVELALLPRTVFGAYKNATSRRNYSKKETQKESAERLFVRFIKVIEHADSRFSTRISDHS
jgi:hypothetical protein